MTLSPETRIGKVEIISLLGTGGMGEVYRARDMRLKREVAVKVLPAVSAADPDRVMRFQREAELLATLNHPNVAAIYGVEEADGLHAIVLELVEGPTLADRLERGPLPLAEALSIARQIAEATIPGGAGARRPSAPRSSRTRSSSRRWRHRAASGCWGPGRGIRG